MPFNRIIEYYAGPTRFLTQALSRCLVGIFAVRGYLVSDSRPVYSDVKVACFIYDLFAVRNRCENLN